MINPPLRCGLRPNFFTFILYYCVMQPRPKYIMPLPTFVKWRRLNRTSSVCTRQQLHVSGVRDHLRTGRQRTVCLQQVANLTKERHPEFNELVRSNGNRDDDSSVCKAVLWDAIQTIPETLGGIAALVTDAVGVMLLATGVVPALGMFLLSPSRHTDTHHWYTLDHTRCCWTARHTVY